MTPPRTASAALSVFFQHASPWILAVGSAAAITWRVSLGVWSGWDALVALGWFLWWPFQEWLIHVFVLHFRPRTVLGIRIDPPNARKHRAHHRDPTNIPLTFIPLHTFVTSLPLLVGGSLALLPTIPLAATSIATFLLLSLHYEWSHYLAHVPWTPPLAFYRRLCTSHTLHHFRHERNWYGVSRTFADTVLGTDPAARGVALSPTVRTLGID